MKYLEPENVPNELEYLNFKNRFNKHYSTQLTCWEEFLLFFHIRCPCLLRCSRWRKKKEYVRLYNRGKQKITQNLNILNILKQLNQVLLLTNKVGQISDVQKWISKHHKVNVINVDDTTDSEDNISYCSDQMLNKAVDDIHKEQVETAINVQMK